MTVFKHFDVTLRNVALFASAATLFSLTTPARADFVPAVNFSGGGIAAVPGTFGLGYQFTVGTLAYDVTAVGIRDGLPLTGQTVRIYKDGTATNLVTQAIFASDSLSSSGVYRYVNLATPVHLEANTTYDLIVDLFGGESIVLTSAGFSTDPDITYNRPIGDFGSGIFVSTDNVNLGSYFLGTFQGQVSVTPEPGSILLVATAAGLMLLRSRKGARGRDRGTQ